jgi:hypothetical protein
MYCYELQPYLVIRGGTSAVITQGENAYLDLSGFQDIVAWLDVRELGPTSPGITVSYQTGPSAEEVAFVNMGSTVVTATGVFVTSMFLATAANPLARFLRWQLSPGASSLPWDLTFRIWVAANAPGRRRPAGAMSASGASWPLHAVGGASGGTPFQPTGGCGGGGQGFQPTGGGSSRSGINYGAGGSPRNFVGPRRGGGYVPGRG